MKTIDRRLGKLERRFGIARNGPIYLLILTDRDLESVEDAYVKILDEAGFLPNSGIGVVDFTVIPRGLNAEEEEKFVRENGAEICGMRVGGFKGGPGVERNGTVQPVRKVEMTDEGIAAPQRVVVELL
jgi:hypothetical protein